MGPLAFSAAAMDVGVCDVEGEYPEPFRLG